MSLSALFLVFCISVIAFFSGYAKRRPSHPFSFPPGPKGLPFLGCVLQLNASEPWFTFTQWASSYGDLVYCTLFGRKILVIQTEDIAKVLLEQRSSVYSDRPPVRVQEDVGSEFNSALLRYGDKWRLHRRLFHQSFRADAAQNYRPMQLKKVRHLLMSIYNSPDHWERQIELYASAVIMSAVYDYDTAPSDDPLVLAAERAIEVFVKISGTSIAATLEAFPFLLKLPVWFPGAILKRMAIQAKSNLHEMIDVPFAYARKRAMSCVSGPCMVSEALKRFPDANSEGFEIALKSSSGTAFIAGVETTSSTLIIFVLAMICYPEVQERAQREIDAFIGTQKLPEFEDRLFLPYVDAVLRETMRWHPVFPLGKSIWKVYWSSLDRDLGLPHHTTKSDVYEGYNIPQGCVVLANLWAMSRDEEKYPNPTEFMPERFFNAAGKLNDDTVAWTFGFGRRVCVGRHFADASVWIAIVHLLAMFKFMKVVDENGVETDPSPEWTTGLVSRPLGVKCRVVPRFPWVDGDKLTEIIRSND